MQAPCRFPLHPPGDLLRSRTADRTRARPRRSSVRGGRKPTAEKTRHYGPSARAAVDGEYGWRDWADIWAASATASQALKPSGSACRAWTTSPRPSASSVSLPTAPNIQRAVSGTHLWDKLSAETGLAGDLRGSRTGDDARALHVARPDRHPVAQPTRRHAGAALAHRGVAGWQERRSPGGAPRGAAREHAIERSRARLRYATLAPRHQRHLARRGAAPPGIRGFPPRASCIRRDRLARAQLQALGILGASRWKTGAADISRRATERPAGCRWRMREKP